MPSFFNFNVTCVMQDMLVILAATSTNTLMNTQKKSSSICKHYLSEHNSNIPPCLSQQFHVLTKCSNKFDCLIKEMLL